MKGTLDMDKPNTTYNGGTVIGYTTESKKGAVIEVQRIELSESARRNLSTKVERLESPSREKTPVNRQL